MQWLLLLLMMMMMMMNLIVINIGEAKTVLLGCATTDTRQSIIN